MKMLLIILPDVIVAGFRSGIADGVKNDGARVVKVLKLVLVLPPRRPSTTKRSLSSIGDGAEGICRI